MFTALLRPFRASSLDKIMAGHNRTIDDLEHFAKVNDARADDHQQYADALIKHAQGFRDQASRALRIRRQLLGQIDGSPAAS